MKKTFLDSFTLKVIALITMTIDHIGLFCLLFAPSKTHVMIEVGTALNYIGRIAAPLFFFFAVEGALKSKNIGKYIAKLAIVGSPILLFNIVGEIITQTTDYFLSFPYGNIYIMLILIVTMVYCFEHKKTWVKVLGILPIIYCIISCCVSMVEFYNLRDHLMIWWLPYMLRPQYDIFGIFLGLGFYGAHKLIKPIYSLWGMDADLYKDTQNYQFHVNLLCVAALVIVSFTHYSLIYIAPDYVFWIAKIQVFAILAAPFILFYNGRRGYHAKWWQWFSYLYYPMHFVLLFPIFLIVSMYIL